MAENSILQAVEDGQYTYADLVGVYKAAGGKAPTPGDILNALVGVGPPKRGRKPRAKKASAEKGVRPRGRAPKGHVWDPTKNAYVKDDTKD